MSKPSRISVSPPRKTPPAPTRGTGTPPPAFRPQPTPRCLQLKSARGPAQPPGQPRTPPAAPPVYRPTTRKIVQPKTAAPARQTPKAPPVYRPQPNPRAQAAPHAKAAVQMKPGAAAFTAPTACAAPRACAPAKNPAPQAGPLRHAPRPAVQHAHAAHVPHAHGAGPASKAVQPHGRLASGVGAKRMNNPPGVNRIPSRPGVNCVQRTTIVIGYVESDEVFQTALGNITNPNPIFAFNERGVKDEAAAENIKTTYGKNKGTDLTKLNIVGHGSPGKLASVNNVNSLLGGLEVNFSQLTHIDLFPCYTMSRRDVDDSSVAFQVAKWAQSKLEGEQTLNMRAGFTSITVGEFIKGNASYYPISSLEHELEAQDIGNYFFLMVKSMLRESGVMSSDIEAIKLDLHDDALYAAGEAVAAIVSAAPKSVWAESERVKGQNISIGKTSISFGTNNEATLRLGFTVASATAANYKDFPRRMMFLTSLEKMSGVIDKVFGEKIKKLYDAHKPKPKPTTEFAFGSTTGFTTELTTGLTSGFVFTPTVTDNQQPATFSFGSGFVFNPQTTTETTTTTSPTTFTFGTHTDK